jgi:hypothetical protein
VLCKQGVAGSIPVTSTNFLLCLYEVSWLADSAPPHQNPCGSLDCTVEMRQLGWAHSAEKGLQSEAEASTDSDHLVVERGRVFKNRADRSLLLGRNRFATARNKPTTSCNRNN